MVNFGQKWKKKRKNLQRGEKVSEPWKSCDSVCAEKVEFRGRELGVWGEVNGRWRCLEMKRPKDEDTMQRQCHRHTERKRTRMV
jgi:hypothetical protein